MANDDDDKTIIQSGDSGPRRPMPGGRGTPGGAPVPPSPAAPAPPVPPPSPQMAPAGQVPPSAIPPQPSAPAYGTPQGPVHRIDVYHGINPIANAANALLSLIVKLRNTPNHGNVEGLYNQVSQEIRQFEARLKQEGHRPELVLASRYALCAAIDEAVLSTPWGANSGWAQRTLLSAFHNETSGGQKFFLILDKMKESPAENLNVLELLYFILSYGFEGKYKVMDRGPDQLAAIRGDLYQAIRRFRAQAEADLAPDWRQAGGKMSSLVQYIPMWVIASCVAAVMLLTYSGFRFALYSTTTPLYEQLNNVPVVAQPKSNNNNSVNNNVN